MRKLLALTLSLLLVFAAMPIAMVSADTMTATHVYTMDEGNRVGAGATRYHWGAGFVDIGGDHGYVYRSETKSDAYSYFRLPANWSTDYGKVTKISFELGGATNGYFYNPGFMLATGVDSNYKYTGAVRGIWSNVNWTAGSWTKVEIDVSDKDTFIIDGTEAVYMCLGAQKSLGVQYASNATNGWFYIDNVTLTYEYEANLPEYDVTIDGEVVDTVMETKTFTVPTPAEGYHYSDGVADYFGGEEITVTGPVTLVSVINTYTVTVGEAADAYDFGDIFTVPTPSTGYQWTDGETLYNGGEEITVTGDITLTAVVATTKATYTMDEGSRIIGGYSYGVNKGGKYGYHEFKNIGTEEEPNYVFSLAYRTDVLSYIQLPKGWAEKPYYKATKLSFQYWKSSDANTGFRSANADVTPSLTQGISDGSKTGGSLPIIAANGGVTYMSKTPTKVSVDLTEDVYDYNYITFVIYSTADSSTEGTNIYFDNVTIEYEYDFDYVEPVEPTTYDITIDGEVVATVEEGTEYTLPELPAGKYYVGNPETTFVVTENVEFTTATYTFDITIDGEILATVDYGTEYTLPELPAGKYYVGNPETTFVVTENVEFITATYTFDVTIDGVVVATVAYGETFTLPAVAEGKQYVDGYTVGQEFVVTEALNFATEDIPEVDGPTTDIVETVDGAAIRLNEEKGMRFYANFKGDLDDVDEMGIIIAPKDLVGDFFTMEDDHIKVEYDHITYDLWENNQFVGSIVNVADKNLTRDFIARAYVVIDGVTYYAETTSVRNIAEIADEFIGDANGGYASLEADVKELVEKWAKAND